MISLVEYAKLHGIDPATARQKAGRNGFKTARKIGRNWMIDENEPFVDLRKSHNRLKAKDIFDKDAYECLTVNERKEILKIENAKHLSGFRQYETTCRSILKFIPDDFISSHTAQEIADVMRMVNNAYNSGKDKK